MADHPYRGAPPHRLWRKAITGRALAEIELARPLPFRITPTDRVVTAGSCFAQHIARYLRHAGFAYVDAEAAHPLLSEAESRHFNYGIFSARYGNIYTTRQLLQLVRRAHGRFTPAEDIWEQDGAFYDPFRPAIQPGGFATRREYLADRARHFHAIHHALTTLDVFIFTLGLTEAWVSALDGAVFPVCPGVIAGVFDPARHVFVNFSATEVAADLAAFITELRALNPTARVVLTVSPVPLAATALDEHVAVATTYSKSALRVAAAEGARLPNCAYFPSYEIITAAHTRGRYFADDLREVTEEGVSAVMRQFFHHATEGAGTAPIVPVQDDFDRMRRYVETVCEEGALDPA